MPQSLSYPAVRLARRRRQLKLVALVSPLFAFILVGFIYPLAIMLQRSIDNSLIHDAFPHTRVVLTTWEGTQLPGPDAYVAVMRDIAEMKRERRHALVAKHLEYEEDGFRRILMNTARKRAILGEEIDPGLLAEIEPEWNDLTTWQVLVRAIQPFTVRNLLSAVDLRLTPNGEIVQVAPEVRVHNDLLIRSIVIAAVVTFLCLLIGFPIALLLSSSTGTLHRILLVCIVLPFWTSILVRTTAWIVLLQRVGVVNDLLIFLGLTEEPLRLMFSRTGVLVAMTHVLIPFMVLPIYSAMKNLPISYVQASLSLGASPFRTFWKIYVPLVSPGVNSGVILVFVLALGFYITPALVGGASDQMYSYVIAYHTTTSLNWGLASALSLVLLTCVALLYFLLTRVLGSSRVSVGVGP